MSTTAPTTSTAAEPEPVDDRAVAGPSALSAWLRTRAAWILGLDVVLIIVFGLISTDHVFWSSANVTSLLLGMTEALLLSLGLAMMLGAGIFDLSLGANLVLSSVMGAKVMTSFQGTHGDPTSYHSPWTAILLGLLAAAVTGIVFGLVNGALIAIGGINSLIATLATLGIGTGVADLVTKGSDIGALPVDLQSDIGLKTFGAVPVPALVAVVATAILWAVVRYSRFGLRVLSIGSSRTSAERAGVRVRLYLMSLTALGGLLAGLAGFIDLSRFGSTALAGHQNDALGAVTAAVIGGTLLEGGYISIVGTIWGAALAVILQAGLVIAGVQSFWQLIVVGGVLLIAVLLDRVTARRRARSTH